MNLRKKLLQLALPMSLEGLLTASADFVDTLMVSSMGETAVSAVGLGTQMFFVQSMTIYGFCGGASTYMAQFWGSGNLRGIRKTLSTTVSGAFVLSLMLFLVLITVPEHVMGIFTDINVVKQEGARYMMFRSPTLLLYSVILPVIMALKSMQQVKLAVGASIAAVVINVTANYILIFGALGMPRMGASGAALATTLSQSTELVILLIGMTISKSPLMTETKDYLSLNRELVRKVVHNAVPTTVNEMMWSGGMSAYNAAYGRISVMASAAAQAADIVTHIFTKAIYSVGDASLILVGEQLGRDEKQIAYGMAKKLLRLNALLGTAAGIVLIAAARFAAGLFHFGDESRGYLIALLCIYGLFLPLKVYNVSLITGVLRAGGDVSFAMITEVSAIWLVSVPLVFFSALILDFPIYIVVLFAQSEDLVKAVILTRRFRSGKWMNNKVRDIDC